MVEKIMAILFLNEEEKAKKKPLKMKEKLEVKRAKKLRNIFYFFEHWF